MDRYYGGRGSGEFGRGFLDGTGPGGRGFGMGRKLTGSDLALLVLRLLADKPRHGYEIIKDLEARSGRFYVPSPGMIYPVLTYLEELGHAAVETEANRKRYHITLPGRAYLEKHRAAAESLLAQFELVAGRMEHMHRALRSASIGGVIASELPPAPSDELMRAQWDLKRALNAIRHATLEERSRIAAILRRATTDIAATATPGEES